MKIDFDKVGAGRLVAQLAEENDTVRLVEPEAQRVLTPDAGGRLQEDACHRLWGRHERCENCTSLRALRTQGRAYKIEIIGSRTYWVESRYLRVDGASCVAEIVNDVTDNLIMDSDRRDEIGSLISNYNHLLITDAMTGVYNRRFLDEHFLPSLACCHEKQLEVNLAFMDVDGFKQVNDAYGHQAGDLLLKDVAGFWRMHFNSRQKNRERLTVRYGGDEFLVITCGEPHQEFAVEIQNYYAQMRRVCYFGPDAQHTLGITFGIAGSSELGSGWVWDDLVALADHRMYEEKSRKKQSAAGAQ